MASILFTCPNTGTTVSTGHHARSTLDVMLDAGGSFRCPACNQIHTWTKENVSLAVGKERMRKDGTLSTATD